MGRKRTTLDFFARAQYKAPLMPPMHPLLSQEPKTNEKPALPEEKTPSPLLQRSRGSFARKAAYLLTFVAGAAGMYVVDRKPPLQPPPLLAPEQKETTDSLHIPGTTEVAPGRLAKVALATNQAVAFVDVKLGDRVKKGYQVFSHWESPEGLEATKMEISRAKQSLVAATARSEAANTTLARLERAQGTSSAQEREDARALVHVRAAELSAAAATLEIAELRFAEADFHFQQAFVTSPIDGTVIDVSVTPGERRQIGGPFRGIVILDPRVLSIRCMVPLAQLTTLRRISGGNKEDMRATVEFGGTTYPATVRTIGLHADERTGNIPVLLELQNTDGELRSGIPVMVTLSQKK